MTTEPFEELGLDRDSSPGTIRLRWRQLASVHHPDKGGSLEVFLHLQELYLEALKTSLEDPCLACQGRGSREVSRGFSAIRIVCEGCQGSGKMWPNQK